jgi:hypothetical protein
MLPTAVMTMNRTDQYFAVTRMLPLAAVMLTDVAQWIVAMIRLCVEIPKCVVRSHR